jgi:hypothetical protein
MLFLFYRFRTSTETAACQRQPPRRNPATPLPAPRAGPNIRPYKRGLEACLKKRAYWELFFIPRGQKRCFFSKGPENFLNFNSAGPKPGNSPVHPLAGSDFPGRRTVSPHVGGDFSGRRTLSPYVGGDLEVIQLDRRGLAEDFHFHPELSFVRQDLVHHAREVGEGPVYNLHALADLK